ncbi:hypothetical protein AAC387_Pa02g2909 [Persea americana]
MFRAVSSRRARMLLSKLQCAKKPLSTSTSPPPIRVAYTADSAGRGTFATRRLRSGDLIHTADPLITHPSPSLLNKVCYFCLRRSGPSAAPDETDPTVRFCGADCRQRSQVERLLVNITKQICALGNENEPDGSTFEEMATGNVFIHAYHFNFYMPAFTMTCRDMSSSPVEQSTVI